MKWQTELSLLLLIACVLAWLFMQKGCGDDSPVSAKSDTVYVMGRPDTVIITDTVVIETVRPKPYAVYLSGDTVEVCDSIRVYENVAGKVTVRDSVRGELLSQAIRSIQDTVLINRVDTLRITTEIVKQRRFSLYAGAMYDTQLKPFIATDLNRTVIIAGYGLTDKAVSVGIGYRLTK